MRFDRFVLLASLVTAVGLGAAGSISCKGSTEADSQPYFDRNIQPILQGSCTKQTTGCHLADPKGNAVGNLDTSSFDMLDRRRDLLVAYGPYNAPGLLTKVSGPSAISVSTLDGNVTVTTDIRHAASSGIDPTSDGYATLKRWLDSGASRANVGPSAPHYTAVGKCKTTVLPRTGFDPAATPAGYAEFVDKVQPVLKKACSAGSCHGNDVADFALTCGDDEQQLKWNAWIASQFIAAAPEASELVRRPLDPARGGVYHEGGIVWGSTDDDGYKALVAWAKSVGAPKTDGLDEGFRYFANRVQPMMVRKGCMFLGCHSPSMFHDLRLTGGSGGHFSLAATRRNYDMSKLMLAIEAPDPNVSRLIKKNLYPFDADIDAYAIGTRHRGGALLEDVPKKSDATTTVAPTLDDCKAYDLDKGPLDSIPSYCIFARWHQVERQLAIAKGPSKGGVTTDALQGIAWVERPPFTDVPQAFDTYRPGASLHLAAAALDAAGNVTVTGDNDVTSGCGLSAATADIRGPSVSWDGTRIAFAARTSADSALAIYTMNADGSSCSKHAAISTHDARSNGILVHDFDPTWAPDGRIVFASTRGTIGQNDVDYNGATLTPSMMLPNSNIYVLDPGDKVRQMTFVLNAELAPSFMRDGRIIFTAEKRAPGFYQLAGRRQNLDGGDYHPFYASRKSIGFEQLTEVAELADRNFIGVFSDKGALGGAGTVGIINRSIGPDQFDRDPADRFYLKSLHVSDPAATGKKGSKGAYRSPAPLPAHGFLASYAPGDPYAFDGGFDLVQVDPRTGARKTLVTRPAGKSIVEPVAIYAKFNHGVYGSRPDEPNGHVYVDPTARDAEIRFIDLPMLATLVFENTRVGRKINFDFRALGLLESLPPPTGVPSFDGLDAAFVATDDYGKMWVKRRRLGTQLLESDGSLAIRIPGGMPFTLEVWDDKVGTLLATQKEEMMVVPGERAHSSFKRSLFDSQCGGCHGSVTGREVDVHLSADILTSASRVKALEAEPVNWNKPPGDARGVAIGAPAK